MSRLHPSYVLVLIILTLGHCTTFGATIANPDLQHSFEHGGDDESDNVSWFTRILQLCVLTVVAAVCAKKKENHVDAAFDWTTSMRVNPLMAQEDKSASYRAPEPPSRTSEPPLPPRVLQLEQQPQPHVPRTSTIRPDLTTAKKTMATPGPEFAAWQLNRKNITKLKEFGRGNFGAVHKGRYADPSGCIIPVALKSLHTVYDSDENLEPRQLFIFEASILMEFDHPNILRMLGVTTSEQPWQLVTEFLEYGDLKRVLDALRSKAIKLTSLEKIHISQNIAAGMLYLATKQFVHRDLAARNCLVAGNSVVKIADFGMARLMTQEDDYYSTDNPNGYSPIRWIAIEAIDEMRFTLRSDVWSFGVVLWELYTYGSRPYGGMMDMVIGIKLKDGYRLERPPDVPDQLWTTTFNCWNAVPKARPDFYSITTDLNMLQARFGSGGNNVRDVGTLAEGHAISPFEDLTDDFGNPAAPEYLTPLLQNAVYSQPAYDLLPASTSTSNTYSNANGGSIPVITSEAAYANPVLNASSKDTYNVFQRLPVAGPGAVAEHKRSNMYDAMQQDRQLYGVGLGDPALMNVPGLDPSAPYYHGICSRSVAERALRSSGHAHAINGTFLVRQSPRGAGKLVMSAVYDGVVWHYKLHHLGEGRQRFYGMEFKNVQAVVDYHKTFAGKMMCVLGNPCNRF